jgi:hypothetical protein
MTHRDPLQTVPSYVSMQTALYKLNSTITPEMVGAFWFPRLVEWMRRFEAARARIGENRFIDIDYREIAQEPLVQAKRVLARVGIPASDDLDAVLAEFLEGNRREQRPVHEYSLDRYGLDEEKIRSEFSDYRARYIERS